MFKIGNIEIKNNIVLAPMAGVCNSAFRKIIKEMGCGLIYAEMVSDKALVYNSKKTIDMLYLEDEERPLAQQIFGNDKESFVKAAKLVYETEKPDIIDINMGCPVPKVAVKSQAGAALLKNPPLIKEIVEAVVASVPIPVTVKIRSGWDETHWNVSKERLESIAEHVYGTCILALSIDSEFETNLDINKVVKMLVIHELGEVVIGDITPFDNITPEEKMEKEHEAIKEVLGDLIKKDEFYSLLLEFDDKKTKEAVFAHHCDKLEADIQAKVYQDMGCQHSLDEQKNNVVFKRQRVQQMVKDGAKSAFDIWYEWDKSLYFDDETFANILDYVKDSTRFLIIVIGY